MEHIKIYAETLEDAAKAHIQEFADTYKKSIIRVMPDAHEGKGAVVGTTIKLRDNFIDPNIVGVDIGCGVLVVKMPIKASEIDRTFLEEFDKKVREKVPAGMNVHTNRVAVYGGVHYLKCETALRDKIPYFQDSIGTLGGGNHFISIETYDEAAYLIIHSGSRNLGVQVCKYYTMQMNNHSEEQHADIESAIALFKKYGYERHLSDFITTVRKAECNHYLSGEQFNNYLHDMRICQNYAAYNRLRIAASLLGFVYTCDNILCDTIHNYIELNEYGDYTIRKGAVSAYKDETLIIPLNMADGSLICVGKGNPDWNYSAPHGAGRLMSRTAAKENINIADYQFKMSNIYSSCVCPATLDEAPQAYKPADEIKRLIEPTVEILFQTKPVYNFKGF